MLIVGKNPEIKNCGKKPCKSVKAGFILSDIGIARTDCVLFGGDYGKPYVNRQGTFYPDKDVKKTAKSFLIENNQFRKFEFVDGSTTIAPKGYIPSGFVKDNGSKDLGVNRVFRPDSEDKMFNGFY